MPEPESFFNSAAQFLAITSVYVGWELFKGLRARREASRKSRPPLAELARADAAINGVLAEAGRDLNAKRVYMTRIHNGEYFDQEDHASVWQMSRTHEWVRDGASAQVDEFRHVMLSRFSEEMTLVLTPGPSWCRVQDLPRSRFRFLLERGGVTAVARCQVFKGRKPIGFVGADFDGVPAEPEKIARMNDLAYQVGQMMD